MSTPPQAVVFDMDGVLIDSEPHWQDAECSVFATLGVDLTPEDCARTTGLRIDEAVAYWHARRPWTGPSIETVSAAVVDAVCERIRAHGVPLPGALEAVAWVQESPLQIAVATSSPRAVISAVFERLELRIQTVCSAEDEAAGKPDPAVYLSAARALGIDPERCVAVEDSRNGVLSARSAGMTVVAVLPVAEADVHLPLTELPEWLTRQF